MPLQEVSVSVWPPHVGSDSYKVTRAPLLKGYTVMNTELALVKLAAKEERGGGRVIIVTYLWSSHAALIPDIPEPTTAMRLFDGESIANC